MISIWSLTEIIAAFMFGMIIVFLVRVLVWLHEQSRYGKISKLILSSFIGFVLLTAFAMAGHIFELTYMYFDNHLVPMSLLLKIKCL